MFPTRLLSRSALLSVFLCTFSSVPPLAWSASLREEASGYRTKGYELQMQGDLAGALDMYKKAVTFDPAYATPHNDMGVILEQLGRFDEAQEAYRRAIAIAPSYSKVHANLAMLHERLGNVEQAIYHWAQRVRLGQPDDPGTQRAHERLTALVRAAEVPASSVVSESSGEARQQAIDLRTQGYAKQQERKLQEALELFDQATQTDATYAAAHNDRGVVLEELGNLGDAEQAYQQALVVDPAYVQAHANLALLYERMGQPDKSLYHWLKRFQLGEPGAAGTQRAYDRLIALGMSADLLNALPRMTAQRPVSGSGEGPSMDEFGIIEEVIEPSPWEAVEAELPAEPALPAAPSSMEDMEETSLIAEEPTEGVLFEPLLEEEMLAAPSAPIGQEEAVTAVVAAAGREEALPAEDPHEGYVVVAEPVPMVSANLRINDGAATTYVPTINLAIDARVIGSDTAVTDVVQSMQFSNDGTVFSELEPYATQRVWVLSEGDGAKTVFMNLLDSENRVLASLHQTIQLDTSSLTIYVNSQRELRTRMVERAFDGHARSKEKFERVTKPYMDRGL